MSVTTENAPVQGQTTLQENSAGEGVYASLFEKINLAPASRLGDINDFLDDAALSEAPAAERLTAAMQVFMDRIRQSGQRVEKLDKTLIDHHIAELDFQISRQLDAVMHHQESSSPYLYKAVTTGQTLKSAEFKWYRINDAGQEVEYFNTKLENVKVVKVNPLMHDIKNPAYEKHNHLEQIELRYEKITWTYKDGNIIHSDSWNERATA
ncbi:type VI secretion system tube protein TssD [Klebsiella pneumoniae]|uniref:type VI secretion system tube protein TssD n=1 Tax=Klebsiella pneumoniae TaxID=573 RepID=UPI003D2F88C2